jgi:hypothetical protein
VEFLLYLIVILAVIALVGHGMWVLASAVIHALFGVEPLGLPAGPWSECVACGASLHPGRTRCPDCGLRRNDPVALELGDLQAMVRELERLGNQGMVDEATAAQLRDSLKDRRRQLMTQTAALGSKPVWPRPRAAAEKPAPLLSLPEATVDPAGESSPPASPAPPVEEPAAPLFVASFPRPAPRRSLTEVLAAFMEQRNILWGELVGGLLIVGCSVALVISLWQKLEENPLYQYGIFVSVTAALFGAGRYTLSHWKLESTSRGLLIIGTLLVPLNLLALTTAQAQAAADPVVVLVEASSLAVFAGLLALAGKVLVPDGRWRFTAAVLVISASQLLVPRLLRSTEANSGLLFLLAGCVPVACQALSVASMLVSSFRRGPLDGARVRALFTMLGLTTFAVAVALGLLVFWSLSQQSGLRDALERVAPLVAVAGLPPLFTGLQIHRGLARAEQQGSARTTGTAVALTGMVVMLMGIALAWPRPIPVIAICALDFAVLTAVAFSCRLPVAHAAALPCLVAAYVAGWLLSAGRLPGMAPLSPGLALTDDTSRVLIGLFCLLALASEFLCRGRLPSHGIYYAAGCAGVAVLSLIGITFPSDGTDRLAAPSPAVLVYAVYGAGGLIINLRWRRPILSSFGLALLTGATLWGLWWLYRGQLLIWPPVLAAEALLMGFLAVLLRLWSGARTQRRTPTWDDFLGRPLARSSEALALAALFAAGWAGYLVFAWSIEFVATAGFVFLLLLLLAFSESSPWHARAAGLLLMVTAVVATGWVATLLEVHDQTSWIAWSIALSSTFMAAIAAASRGSVRDELGRSWLDTAALAALTALALMATVLEPPLALLPAGTGLLLTATAFLLAWGYDTVALSWSGSFLALASIVYALEHWSLVGALPWLGQPAERLAAALLLHATLAFVVARRVGDRARTVSLLLTGPARHSAVLSSAAALPALLMSGAVWPVPAVGLLWLAILWFAPLFPGLIGLSGLCAAAVVIENSWPGQGWGYRTVLLAWAVSCLTAALFYGLGMRRSADEASDGSAATIWVKGAGLLLALLTLKGIFEGGDYLWAAAALVVVSTTWLVVALGQRREHWAFVAGLGVNLAATLVAWHFHWRWWGELLHANVIAAGLFSLLWLALRRRLYGSSPLTVEAAPYLALQIGITVLSAGVFLGAPVLLLVVQLGQDLSVEPLLAGTPSAWLAFYLTQASLAWYVGEVSPRECWHAFASMLLGLGILRAYTVAAMENDSWLAYHHLTAAWAISGAAFLMLGRFLVAHGTGTRTSRGQTITDVTIRSTKAAVIFHPWVRAISAAVILLVVRGVIAHDAAQPTWPTAMTLVVSFTLAGLALWSRQLFDVYASGLLFNLAGAIIWLSRPATNLMDLGSIQVLCLAAAAILWAAPESWRRRRAPESDLRGGWLPFTHLTATLSLCLVGFLIILVTAGQLAQENLPPVRPSLGLALGAMILALLLLVCDPTARFPLAGLYATGLLGVAWVLDEADLGPRGWCWTAPLAVAPFVLFTAAVARVAARLKTFTRALGIPERSAGWFVPSQLSVAAAVTLLTLWICSAFADWHDRLAGPLASATLFAAGVVLAGRNSFRLQLATLSLAAVVVIELGWAGIDPGGRDPALVWLHRSVVVMVSLALLTVVYGLVLARWLAKSAWGDSFRRMGPILGVLGTVMVGIILLQEATVFEGHKTIATFVARMLRTEPPPGLQAGALDIAPMAPVAIASVAAAFVGLIVAALSFALVPGRDPLGLSERGRRWYVYAAEVLLVLLFVHLRLTVPGLFRQGFFLKYWPFILMGLAFAGVGLSEYFQRRGVGVLAEPLERTGVFLPMMPVLAFWVMPAGNYALLWFLTGLLYGLMSVSKRSFRFAILAALSANAGLWVLMHHHEFYFYQHPQLWLIPPALIVLVSEHLNRERLSEAQSTGLRYLALMVIYVSSTADMFIAGLGKSVVLPLVLAVLSVSGVLAGMLLRVRAFLFLGVTFLLLVILTMIWHAGVNRHHTWILWSAGIVLGVAILTLFGIFEKRRNDVLHLVEELRQWD